MFDTRRIHQASRIASHVASQACRIADDLVNVRNHIIDELKGVFENTSDQVRDGQTASLRFLFESRLQVARDACLDEPILARAG